MLKWKPWNTNNANSIGWKKCNNIRMQNSSEAFSLSLSRWLETTEIPLQAIVSPSHIEYSMDEYA